MGKTFNASVDWLGMVENPDQDVNPSVNGEKAQTGIEFEAPKRDGERINSDGSESTHIMKTETIDGINWVSFPTLFQNEDGTWDNTYELMIKKNPDNWKPAMLEAKRRGELIHFGPNKKEALEYGKGSWKPKAQIGDEIKPYVAVQDNTYVDIPPPPPAPTKVIDPFPHGTISQAPPEKAWYKKLLNVVAHPMEAFGRSIHNQDWWTGDLGQGLPMSPQHSTNIGDGFDMVNTFFNPASWVEDISDSESITEGVVNTAMLIPIVRGGKVVGYTNKANKSKPIFHKGSSYIEDPNSLYRVVNVPPGGTSVDELVKAAEYGTTIPKVTTSGRRAGYSKIQRETPFDVLNTTSNQGWILGKGTNDPYNLMNLYGGKNPYVIKMGRGNPLVGPESLKTINQRTDILRDFSFPYTQNVGKWNPATGQYDVPIELGAGVFTTVGKSADDLAKIMPGSIVNPNMLSRGNNNITTIFGPKGFQVRQPQEVLPMDEYIKYMKNNPNFKFQEGGPTTEREKYIQFALDTESGYHYIRNKDSAVKKLGADGKWDGKTYYKIYEDGKYYPHYVGDEKRATIGHGHAPVDRDIFEEYKEGITETQALELLGKDIDEKLRLSEIYYNSRFGDGKWDDLTESEQFMLNDYTFNVRGGFHKTFRNFAKAIHDKDHKLAKKEYKRALGERNEIFMERYLKPWMDIQIERTTVAPPLEDMPLPIGTFPTDSEGNPQSMSTNPNEPKKETSWWRGEEGWIPDELELPWFMDGASVNARGNTPSSVTDIPATADGSRAENATMSRSAMDPMPSLNNDLTVNDNLALDNTIADLSEETNIPQVKYGGQYMWGLDLRSTKAQAGKEVKSDDIYANDRYSQSATKYKKMLPKYQSQGQLPKAQFGRHSIMSGNAHGLRPEGSTGVLGDFYDKSGISDGKYKWLLGDTKTGGAAGAFVSNLLDIANIPSNLMAEATEYFGGRGDKEFNFLDAMPGFSGNFSFTNMYGEPTKTVSGTADDQGNPLVDNFWGALATDIFTDPTSYVGLGLVTKGTKLPNAIGKTTRNVKKGLGNAKTNINNAMGGTKMTSKGLQIWDGEDWVLSNKQQALNTIKKIIEQKKILQNQAASKVKGAQQKLYNLEKNKAKLISDFEKLGFDTKELQSEAWLDMFTKKVKMDRSGKFQQNIVDDMTVEFWELSDFLDNVGGDKFDDLLDAINKGAKLDDELIKKHLSKSAYERFKNIKNTLDPSRQYDEGSTRIK